MFYELFVRSFQDSNGDGIGDLRGLIARLDELNDGNPDGGNDLGVTGLWLMPVFASPSYHGYDVTDYRAINPDYGTLDDFKLLLTEAHKRGIRVIVDFVINHSSAQHPWFVDSASSPTSAKRDWYSWRKDDPGWTQPWGGNNRTWHKLGDAYYFGLFWGGMPDLNLTNPAVRAEMEATAKYWLDLGLDGFRLDAAKHIIECGDGQQADCPETHEYWRSFSRYVRSVKPDALLVGENWSDTDKIAAYFGSTERVPGGDELPASFNFPLASALVKALQSGDALAVRSTLDDMRREYPAGALDAPFLTNHDMPRLASMLDGLANVGARLRQAPALLMTLSGAPFLYYGEEVGITQGRGNGDEAKRTPMPWDGTNNAGFTSGAPWYDLAPGWQSRNVATQRAQPNSVWQSYRRWIAARRSSTALREGSLELLQPARDNDALLAFTRNTKTESALVLHNVGDSEIDVDLASPPSTLTPLLLDTGITLTGTKAHLPPHSSAIWTSPRPIKN